MEGLQPRGPGRGFRCVAAKWHSVELLRLVIKAGAPRPSSSLEGPSYTLVYFLASFERASEQSAHHSAASAGAGKHGHHANLHGGGDAGDLEFCIVLRFGYVSIFLVSGIVQILR